jgi:hypothetical protein
VSSCRKTQQPSPVGSVQVADKDDDCACTKDHIIEIGTSTVSCKWIYLKSNSSNQGNTVLWKAADPKMSVKIVFDDPNPFPRINCPGTQKTCQSGGLDPNIKGSGSIEYKYHASTCDDQGNCGQEVDPGIIIVP